MSYHIVINKGATRWPNAIKNVPIDSKNMYCCKFLKQLYDQKYIINIDEAGFGKSIKENYSWLPRGRSASIEMIYSKEDLTWFSVFLTQATILD